MLRHITGKPRQGDVGVYYAPPPKSIDSMERDIEKAYERLKEYDATQTSSLDEAN
jgi:hypothetical protein